MDYAGLFPPAKLSMELALKEYKGLMEPDDSWLVNRFVIAASQLANGAELWAGMREDVDDRVPATVIAKALTTGATASASLQTEQELIKQQVSCFDVSGLEIKLPLGDEFAGCLGALKKQHSWFADRDIDVYIEFAWDEAMHEAMIEASSAIEGIGFKARTGGVVGEAFPSVEQVASFISEVSGLEAPFKFTAGLHEPIRYYDKTLDCYHHGFLNVTVASALAMIQNATVSEIEQVLSIEDGKHFLFSEDTIECLGSTLSLKDIDEWWLYFGGYGSCCTDVAIEGLKKIGLI